MRPRTILWIIVLAAIFGFGWYKSYENRADQERRAAWDERMQRIRTESWQEYRRVVAWLRNIRLRPGGRQQVVEELPGGDAISFRETNGLDVASWTHPDYAIRVNFAFAGDQLVSLSANAGDLSTIHPMPERTATSSGAERVRRFVTGWGGWLWIVCLVIAVVPWSFGLVAAEMMLLVTLACGVAWTVSPYDSITIRGILSNDPLFFAAIMLVISLVFLVFRIAPAAARSERLRTLRFGMRTLLAIMGVVAVLSAMGPLGFFAMCVFAIGSILFYVLLQTLIGNCLPLGRRSCDTKTA